MKIVFFVQNLTVGGVVRQIATQAEHFERRGHTFALVGLFELDEEWRLLWQDRAPARRLLGSPHSGVLSSVVLLARAIFELRRELERQHAEVLYAYHGNVARFVAWLATRRSGVTLVWGQRGAGRRYSLRQGWRRALPFYLCRRVSRSVPLVISNSDAGRARRAASGFRCRTQVTIPNGFDTNAFRPDPAARAHVRAEWGVAEEPVVGLVGRLDLVNKSHRHFLQAAALVSRRTEARFVIVGDVPGDGRSELEALGHELELTSRLHWAGLRADMPAVYNALDILCSASRWEGCSNVIGEAMATGIPCVVTDAGDSAKILGGSGIVVPWGEPERLADALETMMGRLPDLDPMQIRRLITSRFSVKRCADDTLAALEVARTSR